MVALQEETNLHGVVSGILGSTEVSHRDWKELVKLNGFFRIRMGEVLCRSGRKYDSNNDLLLEDVKLKKTTVRGEDVEYLSVRLKSTKVRHDTAKDERAGR